MSKILKVTRTATFVRIIREVKVHDGSEKHDVTAHETPLKKFDETMQDLCDVVANVMEFGQGYKKGMVIDYVALTHTKAGTRSAVIGFSKHVDAVEHDHPMDTVSFQIDDAAKGEEGGSRRQCSKKHAEMVAEFIDEAEKYAKGKRQQQMLNFADSKPEKKDEAGGTGTLPFEKAGAAAPGS